MSAFLLINGPNLNVLGSHETAVNGATRVASIPSACVGAASNVEHGPGNFPVNAEHDPIDRVQLPVIGMSISPRTNEWT